MQTRELTYIPAFGFETKRISALECHSRHWSISAHTPKDTERLVKNFDKFLGYIPFVGISCGIRRFVDIMEDRKTGKSDSEYKRLYCFKAHLFRSGVEMSCCGFILFPVDILVTIGRELKLLISSLVIKKSSPKRRKVVKPYSDVKSKSMKVSLSESKEKRVFPSEIHEIIGANLTNIKDLAAYAQVSKLCYFSIKKKLLPTISVFGLNHYNKAPYWKILGNLEAANLDLTSLKMLKIIKCPFDNSKTIEETHELRFIPNINNPDLAPSIAVFRLAQACGFKDGIKIDFNTSKALEVKSNWVVVPKNQKSFRCIKLDSLIDFYNEGKLDQDAYTPSMWEAFIDIIINSKLVNKPSETQILCSEGINIEIKKNKLYFALNIT